MANLKEWSKSSNELYIEYIWFAIPNWLIKSIFKEEYEGPIELEISDWNVYFYWSIGSRRTFTEQIWFLELITSKEFIEAVARWLQEYKGFAWEQVKTEILVRQAEAIYNGKLDDFIKEILNSQEL